MPQLRDSSSHQGRLNPVNRVDEPGRADSTGNPDSQEEWPGQEHVTDFARVFGIETEYGISVTQTQRPVAAAEVARAMFEPLVRRQRATNTYLVNGARLYLDVGSHPEYAGAEARTPTDALLQDAAGERVIAGLAASAQETLAERLTEPGLRLHVYKNNRDAAGNSFGCHENYLLRRTVPLSLVEQVLVPFLATRLWWAGAGRVLAGSGAAAEAVTAGQQAPGQATGQVRGQGSGQLSESAAGNDWRFELSQRADILDEAVSSSTTRSRPMINTRDEPHASPELFRRLHVIAADSNRSQTSTWLRLATTHLVLCLIEQVAREQPTAQAVEPVAEQSPGQPVEPVAGKPVGQSAAGYSLTDSLTHTLSALPAACAEPTGLMRRASQGQARALRDVVLVQRLYCDLVTEFAGVHRQALLAAGSLSAAELDEVLSLWRQLVEAAGAVCSDQPDSSGQWSSAGSEVESQSSASDLRDRLATALPDWVEWAAKLRVIQAFAQRHPAGDWAELEQLDLSYHDISRPGVYEVLTRRGQLPLRQSAAAVETAMRQSPTGTRASLRSAFVSQALRSGLEWSCDWTHCEAAVDGRRHEAELLDPFADQPTPAFRCLLSLLSPPDQSTNQTRRTNQIN